MDFNHKQLCEIEWEAERAVSAIRQFADKPTREKLNAAAYILAEVRNAGVFLCNPNTDSETRHQVVERLCQLFKEGG